MPHRDNEGQKRDKMVAISIQDQILGSSILRCFLEITGRGGRGGQSRNVAGQLSHFPGAEKRGGRNGVKRKKKKKEKRTIGLCASNKEADFLPISTKRGTDICISVVQGSVTNRWSKDGRKIRLHSMIFPGENRRGRDSFSTGYLIPPPPFFLYTLIYDASFFPPILFMCGYYRTSRLVDLVKN